MPEEGGLVFTTSYYDTLGGSLNRIKAMEVQYGADRLYV